MVRAQCGECGAWVEFGDPETEIGQHNDGCPVIDRLQALEGYDL